MKCGNSTFNAQSSRVIITAVHVGAMKAHGKKRKSSSRQDELSLPQKLMVFRITTPLNANVLFAGFFECHLVYNQTQSSDAVFSLHCGFLYHAHQLKKIVGEDENTRNEKRVERGGEKTALKFPLL
jgi:hypothetical protein